jgi:hypothetical protein
MYCEMHYAILLARSVLASYVLGWQKGDVFVGRLREREGTRNQDLPRFRCSEAADPIVAGEG